MHNRQLVHWRKKTIFFLISQCITLFGSTLVQMAIIWYVTMQTSSGTWVAAFTICSYLPQFLISFVGGVWADRYNRKKLIIGSDMLIAVVTLVMMLAIPYISDTLFLLDGLLVMSVIRSLGAGIQTPAVNAVIPQLVPKEQLMRYNGMNAAMQSIVQFAAPAAAGAIFAISTLELTMMVDVSTAAIGIGILSSVFIPKQNVQRKRVSVFTDMKLGIHYAFSDRIIGKLLIVYGAFTFLTVPAGFLAGLLVCRIYGDTYWYLTVVELIGFVGMTLGGLIISMWGDSVSRVKILFVSLTAYGILAMGMGIARNFILYLILMLSYGIAMTIVQTSITTLLQEKTEIPMQGRIFGLLGSMYSGFLPIGMGVFGPLADVIPLQYLMIGAGITLIFIALIIRYNRYFWACR